MGPDEMPALAGFVARGLDRDGDPGAVAPEVTAWRRQFDGVRFTAQDVAAAER